MSLQRLMIGEARARSKQHDKAFRRRAQAVERRPAWGPKRERRMSRALEDLQMAVFLRVLADDYADEDPMATLGSLEEEATINARWAEARMRINLAAAQGALKPSRFRETVAIAAELGRADLVDKGDAR